jgi:hypothetical protein
VRAGVVAVRLRAAVRVAEVRRRGARDEPAARPSVAAWAAAPPCLQVVLPARSPGGWFAHARKNLRIAQP